MVSSGGEHQKSFSGPQPALPYPFLVINKKNRNPIWENLKLFLNDWDRTSKNAA